MAGKLAAKYRVITWDRANLGRADIVLKGARDLDLWTGQLAVCCRKSTRGRPILWALPQVPAWPM